MSDPIPPSPPPTAVPPSIPAAFDRLRAMDLLLVLIIGLGATRLLGLLAHGLLSGTDAMVDRQGLAILMVVLLGLAIQAAALIGAVYLVAVRWRGLDWADLGLRPLPRGWVLRAALATLLAFPVVGIVNLSIQSLMETPQSNPQFALVAPMGFSWPALIAMLAMVGVLVPVAEELFFRGLIYGWLRHRSGVVAAALVSAVFFAVPHGIFWLIPALTLLGLLLVFVYEKSGSLWAAALTHGLFNSITTIFLYLALALDLKV